MFLKIKRLFSFTGYLVKSDFNIVRVKREYSLEKIEGFDGIIKKIVLGDDHHAIITDNGELYMWGKNEYGKLGIVKIKDKNLDYPTKVPFFETNKIIVTDVVLGKNHTLALDDKGRVFSWGKGSFSSSLLINLLFPKTQALGHDDLKDKHEPWLIKTLINHKVIQISSGKHFACALTDDGNVWVWGRGEFGMLGLSNTEHRVPVINSNLEQIAKERKTKIKKIESCFDHSLCLLEDGSVFGFGNNDYGVLGIKRVEGVDFCDAVNYPKRMDLDDNIKIKDITIGETISGCIDDQNRVYYSGLKVNFSPELMRLNYQDPNQIPIKYAVYEKGISVLTADNMIYSRGGSFFGSVKEEAVTGLKRIDLNPLISSKKIVDIGGKHGLRYILTEN